MSQDVAAGTTAEESVRSYLLWLEDPAKMRDQSAIDEAAASVVHEADPIARLKAISRLEALEAVDGSAYREAFLANAKSWAADNGISMDAFRRLGVSAKDLRDAGFAVSAGSGRAKSTKRTRVTPEAVRASVPDGQFRIAEVEERSGASTATVRKVVMQMIDEGLVVDLGPDQSHAGRGRAPLVYRKA